MELARFTVSPATPLRDVMACIDRNTQGIALVVDADCRLLFTITDGDLRRAVLHGLDLNMSAADWAARTLPSTYTPVTAPYGTDSVELLRLMQAASVRHVPLLDAERRVVDMVPLQALAAERLPELQAVVMAGGAGRRLRPLTAEVPKPMLPVGDRPLMEHTIAQLRDAGIRRVSITTHYKADAIVRHFGDGKAFGVEICYVNEHRPLGTAGSLALLPPWDTPLLVLNGDVLTRVNHRSMLTFHQENQAVVTAGVRQYDVEVPYGVFETEGLQVRGVSEKPMLRFLVNAGVYLLEPAVRSYLDAGERIDMPDLLRRLIEAGQRVICFPISEYWVDVGRHADYEHARQHFSSEAAT